MSEERWAKIPGWPQYEISDHGRVRSWRQHSRNPKGHLYPWIRKTSISKATGYHMILLSEGPKKRNRVECFSIHRLVAMVFVDGDKSLQVSHLDGCRTNNHYSNLKWCTQKENMEHARAHGTLAQGERSGHVKLCDRAVRAVVRMRECGFVLEDIAYFFEINSVTILDFIEGRSRATALGRDRSIRKAGA